jgi:hypothetical protein
MNLNVAGKNLLLSGAWDPSTITAALFTGDDFTADELTGTGYARQSVTYDAPAGGVLTVDDEALAVFTIPDGTVNFSHAGLFMGATRIAEGAITAQSYSTGGSYTLNEASITIGDPA